jgi:streptogramin lyase
MPGSNPRRPHQILPNAVYGSVRRVAQIMMALALMSVAVVAVPRAAMADDLGFRLGHATFARSLAMGPDGNLWFAARDNDESGKMQRIGRVTSDGDVEEFAAPAPAWFFSIADGADGNLWFTERNGIGRITPAGEVTSFSLSGGVTPTAVTRGPDGNIWFAARHPDAIGRISPTGDVTSFHCRPEARRRRSRQVPPGTSGSSSPRRARSAGSPRMASSVISPSPGSGPSPTRLPSVATATSGSARNRNREWAGSRPPARSRSSQCRRSTAPGR